MFHEVDDIEQELHRYSQRPSAEETPPVLCVFDVATREPVEEYAERVRSVLAAAVSLSLRASFEDGDLPVDEIPRWFSTVSDDPSSEISDFALAGRRRYLESINERGWGIQEWLYQFDPDSEFRGWAWWDLTYPNEGQVRFWVDSWGESFFACDELRWVLYTAGGIEVVGPSVVGSGEWFSAIAADVTES